MCSVNWQTDGAAIILSTLPRFSAPTKKKIARSPDAIRNIDEGIRFEAGKIETEGEEVVAIALVKRAKRF